jgi:GTP cyclohydrolase FolE2
MAKTLSTEFETPCPCCGSTLVVDTRLRRVVRHVEKKRDDMPELSHAQRIVEEQARRREAIFEESKLAEQSRADALAKRFEEALQQAREEPVTRPDRDFDLD